MATCGNFFNKNLVTILLVVSSLSKMTSAGSFSASMSLDISIDGTGVSYSSDGVQSNTAGAVEGGDATNSGDAYGVESATAASDIAAAEDAYVTANPLPSPSSIMDETNCPSGYTYDTYMSMCYKAAGADQTFTEAKQACVNDGARLFTFMDTPQMEDFFSTKFMYFQNALTTAGYQGVWIDIEYDASANVALFGTTALASTQSSVYKWHTAPSADRPVTAITLFNELIALPADFTMEKHGTFCISDLPTF